jgi:hypothetical protein
MYQKGSKRLSLVAEADFDWQSFDTLQRELNEALADIDAEVNEIRDEISGKLVTMRSMMRVLRKRQGVLEAAMIVTAKPDFVNNVLDRIKNAK